ncbi:hypothetical protein AB0L06_40645 [Spirillospora sp. NPDC052269]
MDEGRYWGWPPALAVDQLEEVRAAFRDEGASIAALARRHGASRVAVGTALIGLLLGLGVHRRARAEEMVNDPAAQTQLNWTRADEDTHVQVDDALG